MWKNVGNLASEEGTSCENPTSFGTEGQNCGKNVGYFASEKARFCEKSRILVKTRGFLVQCRAQTVEKM